MLRLGRALDEVLFVLGQATHFVQDLNQPLHAAWGETRAEHNEVEAQMLYRSWQKNTRTAASCSSRTIPASRMRSRRIPHSMHGPSFFDREIGRVTELAWDQAVNDTANLWQSVFWNALGPERAWQLYGISAPVRETGHGSLC
jgi:hypothetical protein